MTSVPHRRPEAHDELEYGLLLLAYVVCSDEQIHSAEVEELRRAGEELNVSEGTLIAVQDILADAADKIPLETVLRQIPTSRRTTVFGHILAVAWADRVMVPAERALLERVAAQWSIPTTLLDPGPWERPVAMATPPADDPLPVEARIVGALNRLFGKGAVDAAAGLVPAGFARRMERAQTTLMLSGPGYDEAVALCARVASEDFQQAEAALVQTLADIGALRSQLGQAMVALEDRRATDLPGHVREVHAMLDGVRRSLDAEVADEIHRLRASMRARQRALGTFSVAFMGRTKAGKSTLHAVVTGEGWDAIGVGRQRTTRFNRVYEWRNVRVIDTPGIGAPGGRTDEDIARSVIDEADVVCYVVTDDSQQATEFRFLHVLREHLKPLVVLLNVKNNLRTPERLNRFLRNPDRAFREGGTDGVRGHEQRIRRYAREHYGHDLFPVLPVHLLAAQMSREMDHEEHRDALYRASRMQDFLDHLRLGVLRDGPLRRSHTLLGCTVLDLHRVQGWLDGRVADLARERMALEGKQAALRVELARCACDAQEHLRTELGKVWAQLESEVTPWVEEHWSASTEALQIEWARHLDESGFDARLRGAIEAAAASYRTNVALLLEEVGRDLRLSAVLGRSTVSLTAQDSSVMLRTTLRFGGLLVGAVGALVALLNPVGWAGVIAMGLGTVANLLSNLLTSSATKRRKAVDAIRTALLAQVNEQRKAVDAQAQVALAALVKEAESTCDAYFGTLLSVVVLTKEAFAHGAERVGATRTTFGRRYGARILDWIEDRVGAEPPGESTGEVLSCEVTNDRIRVVVARQIHMARDLAQVVGALQTRVRIETPTKVHETREVP